MEARPDIWLWMIVSAGAAFLSLGFLVYAYRRFPPETRTRENRVIRAIGCYSIAALSVLALFLWIKVAVKYSGIAYDSTTVFSLGITGFGVLTITVVWLQVLFVWVHRLLMEVESSGLSGPKRIGALVMGILAALLVSLVLRSDMQLSTLGFILLGFLGLFDLFIERRVLNLTWMAVWMALLSAGAAYGLTAYSRMEGKLLAEKLTQATEAEVKELAQRISSEDTLLILLSTPVPFTVQEKVLRREIAPIWARLPHLTEHFELEKVMVVNTSLEQSVIEEQTFAEADKWLGRRDSAGGISLLRWMDSGASGYILTIPNTGTFSGNVALLKLKEISFPYSPSGRYDFSIFSGLFLLMILFTSGWVVLGSRLKITPISGAFSFFDKPSLRNRIQLWLAGFTLGSFLLIGWVSYTFFMQYGIIEEGTMYQYLSALLNLYVFLLLAALAVAVVVGNSITRPLAAIGEKLQGLRLGRNEPLDWSGQDELGELVAAYNKMIVEVEKSAELLRQSEREGAWREMARQVAHEIKNPLTPMKLSIQHLQRAHQADPDQAAPLIRSVSNTLVEQIDTLTRIAGEFSNFAQMPQQQKELFDLRELAQAVFHLFAMEQQSSKTHVTLDMPAEPIYVDADRTQITRVLNNLVKNALQSIPDDRPGTVEIQLTARNEQAGLLSVRDNGAGIPEDIQSKVFYPNFTTKNSGMGLGLAMCKNIIDATGGRIWFETADGKGTVFFVELPRPHVAN